MSSLERERELFEKCLHASAAERVDILASECPDDLQMRERVLRMLERHAELADDEGDFLRLGNADPDRIGPYRILQRLGEGGMGIVYAAEQREPVRRRVAVKVLRAGFNSREVLARFDAERQALSLMTHPNIARILDAGTTADRRPYIVMEYVPGEPITRYCDKAGMELRARLRLFCTVCEAVQHAHQKGLIHRDLKPSNILVTEEDGQPVAKIIDFGIAKAVTQRLTEHTLETRVGSLLGTPDYMSPEQAEVSPLDVDTRADVYALGAVLYHLLAGVPPRWLAGSGKSFLEMQQFIRDCEPDPPSARLEGAAARQVKGELDWITLKALEKDRSRRYSTAAAFAEDIHRYLEGEVPEAGPHTVRYKLAKFAQRHAVGVSVMSGAFLLVTTFAVLMVLQVQQTTQQRDRANREAHIARAVTGFTSNLFELASPQETGTPDISARALLDAGVERLEREMADEDAEVRAALYEAAGKAYHGIGAHAEAERLAEKSVQLYRAEGVRDTQGYADALVELAHSKREDGDLEEAEKLGREALGVADVAGDVETLSRARIDLADTVRKLGQFPEARELLDAVTADPAVSNETLAEAYSLLGRVRLVEGDFTAAEADLAEAIRRSTQPDGSLNLTGEIATSGLASLYSAAGEVQRAIDARRALLDTAIQRYGDNHIEVATAWNNLAFALLDDPEQYAEAEKALLKSIEIKRSTVSSDHPTMLTSLSNLAWLYGQTERWQDALRIYAELLAARERRLGPEHIDTANARLGLGRTLTETGDPRRGEEELRRAWVTIKDHFGETHWRSLGAQRAVGQALLQQRKFNEAEALLRPAVEQLTASLGASHPETQRATDVLKELEQARKRR